MSAVLDEIAEQADNVGELKSDRVVTAFERQILSGHLATGARLPTEDELCEILRVSRSVVRDSIRTLAARGLVVVRQGSGTVIAEPRNTAFTNSLLILLARSGLSMGEVVQARASIETAIVQLAAMSGTEDEWNGLETALDDFEQAVNAGDDQAATLLHTRFHAGLVDATHQLALSLMLKPMTEITTVTSAASVRRIGSQDWGVAEHRPILTALRSRNSEAAARAIAAHYANYDPSTGESAYREFLERRFSDAYFDAVDSKVRSRSGRNDGRPSGRSRGRVRSSK